MMRIITRTRMRQAFNTGNWKKSRRLAFKLVETDNESELARSVIIRSYWNEKDYSYVEKFINLWPNSNLFEIEKLLPDRLEREHAPTISPNIPAIIPSPGIEREWNPDNLISNYYQEGSTLWLKTPETWAHWEMPVGFILENTNPALLELAIELLLRPWISCVKKPFSTKRTNGSRYGLAFSAGIDSTAAMLVLPENVVLGYHQRNFDSMIDHRNALRLIDYLKPNKEIIIVKSNHECIRTFYEKPNGFSTDYASGVHLVLLADFLDLKGICFGMPIDNGWLNRGRKYRNFADSGHWKYWSKRFDEAGLSLVLPINMISEAGAMKICQSSGIIGSLNSCLRGDGINGCGNCWKCFNKNGPRGEQIDYQSVEIQAFLNKRPLKTAMHALWAIKKMNVGHLVPDLEHLLAMDFSWWEDVYIEGFKILPEDLSGHIKKEIFAILKPIENPSVLENADLFPAHPL